ncbi:MAG: hypothetical protein PUP93_34005 [Rhizonema sp. NSF051]|nr:hypothetical protein [Rhizonema sp. NSF051]
MTSLSLLKYGEIRVTSDSRFSVFDTIEVVGGKKNPRGAWDDLQTMHPEVVGKTDNFQFPGQGQRLTPVANTENIFYIIGLLPGAVGKAYREDAAKEMCRKYGISYESLVETETSITEVVEDVSIATLEVASRIADGLLQIHKTTISKLEKIQDIVQSSTIDVKGEIREGNHVISEDVKAVQQELLDIKNSLANIEKSAVEFIADRKPRGRKDLSLAFHCKSEKQYIQLLQKVNESGMSRSQFFLETVLYALGLEY